MKKTFIISLLVAMALSVQAQRGEKTADSLKTLTIHSPKYKECTTPILNLLRVTCSKKETTLFLEAEKAPGNWISLSENTYLKANEKQYNLLKTEGIPIGEKCYLPQSGKLEFSLSFEPLPFETPYFDFLEETKNSRSWGITGIQLTDKLPKGTFPYTIKGTLSTKGFDGWEFPINRYDNQNVVGKIKIKGNQFEYHGIADSAMFCRIVAGAEYANFIVEKGTILINMKTNEFPSGTPLNDAYAELTKLRYKHREGLDSIRKSIIQGDMDRATRIKKLNELEYGTKHYLELQKKYIKPFILKHANDEVGTAACQSYLAMATPEHLEDIYPHLGEWILSRQQIKEMIAQIECSKKMASGQPFIDFEGEDINGNKVKLSDYVGKGKYVIVDYSASWCGPCKAEMPNLASIYNTYKGDRFDMVTVMVWDRLEASKKMLKEFDVQWKSIVNVGMKPMELYGFSGIPRIMLIDPDGIILYNDLRGTMIKEKLEKIFQTKRKGQSAY